MTMTPQDLVGHNVVSLILSALPHTETGLRREGGIISAICHGMKFEITLVWLGEWQLI